jgi:SAM-dependent methyltransferase
MATATNTPDRTIDRADYALERTGREYERLQAQSRAWEHATARALDAVGLAPGASCLDAGCGPGETMRMFAERVGPSGSVFGIDVDADVGAYAEASLRKQGYERCHFRTVDLNVDAPVPGGPYDLVYARLLLFHTPHRTQVLRRLWEAVAPGGHLLVQDYDLRSIELVPPLDSADEVCRVLLGAFAALECDTRAGIRLPQLFGAAGIGEPDGTDIAGRLEPLRVGRVILEETFRSVLPVAYDNGVTDAFRAEETLAQLATDAVVHADYSVVWPLLLSAWKCKR